MYAQVFIILQSACQSILGQEPETQMAPEGTAISVSVPQMEDDDSQRDPLNYSALRL